MAPSTNISHCASLPLVDYFYKTKYLYVEWINNNNTLSPIVELFVTFCVISYKLSLMVTMGKMIDDRK
jgi:hypothetical protein